LKIATDAKKVASGAAALTISGVVESSHWPSAGSL
jgi:hypothetical protein